MKAMCVVLVGVFLSGPAWAVDPDGVRAYIRTIDNAMAEVQANAVAGDVTHARWYGKGFQHQADLGKKLGRSPIDKPYGYCLPIRLTQTPATSRFRRVAHLSA